MGRGGLAAAVAATTAIAALAVALASACSTLLGIENDPSTGDADVIAPTDAVAPTDVAVPLSDAETGPRHCMWNAPFRAPELVAVSAPGPTDLSPRLTDDELTIYFWSTRSSPAAIHVAHRTSLASLFDAPVRLDLEPAGAQSSPAVGADGSLLFQLQLDAGDPWHIHRAERAPDGGFAPAMELTALRVIGETFEPFVQGEELWFTATPGGNFDVYRARLVADGGVIFGGLVAELETAEDEHLPTLSADGQTVYFSSRRSDGGTAGGHHIWRARRNAAGTFEQLAPVTELNSAGDEAPGWLSADECRLYFSSTREGNGHDIYVATRLP